MTDIREALNNALQHLELLHTDSRLEAELLLSEVLKQNRAYLYAHPEQQLDENQIALYDTLIHQRVQGIPIAYITGTREFWSLTLKVNQATLIPRHETERLVELALEWSVDEPNTRILDLGTGSGAIGLALAKERPNWELDACDCSEDALNVARENAATLGITNIHFYRSDWLKQLPNKLYHAIVSNPPYIAEHDPHLLEGDVRFEPQTALVSSQEGLADLQYIIKNSVNYLMPDGLLLLEHGYDQKSHVQAMLHLFGYRNVQTWQDILGHDRVSGGWRPQSTE